MVRRSARSLFLQFLPFVQRWFINDADNEAKDVLRRIELRAGAAVPLLPGLLDKFSIEPGFCKLTIALHRYEASGRVHAALQSELQVIEHVASVTRLKVQFCDRTEIRFQREFPLERLRKKSRRNLIGERVAPAPGGFYWRAVFCHLCGQNTPLLRSTQFP